MIQTMEDAPVVVPGTDDLHDAVKLKIASDGWDRDYAIHQRTDSEFRNKHKDSQAGVEVGNGGLRTYVKGAGDKEYSFDSVTVGTVKKEDGEERSFGVDPRYITDHDLEITTNEPYPGVDIKNGRNGQPTVKRLTGQRAERAHEIITKRAARLLGERATGLARAKIQSLQNGIDKVEGK